MWVCAWDLMGRGGWELERHERSCLLFGLEGRGGDERFCQLLRSEGDVVIDREGRGFLQSSREGVARG